MLNREAEATELSLSRIRKISKVINRLLKFLSALLLAFLVVTILLSILCSLGLLEAGLNASPLDLVILSAYGLVIIGLVFVVASIFSDVAKGESPFSLAQVNRFRIIAVFLLVYVVLDAFMSTGTVAQVHVGELELGYDLVDNSGGSTLSVNIGALLGAGVFWALSLIFEYGVLLQELSDETL